MMGTQPATYDSITELSDLVNSTENAEKEVAPSIHKHLEGDSIHAQKRALTVCGFANAHSGS